MWIWSTDVAVTAVWKLHADVEDCLTYYFPISKVPFRIIQHILSSSQKTIWLSAKLSEEKSYNTFWLIQIPLVWTGSDILANIASRLSPFAKVNCHSHSLKCKFWKPRGGLPGNNTHRTTYTQELTHCQVHLKCFPSFVPFGYGRQPVYMIDYTRSR